MYLCANHLLLFELIEQIIYDKIIITNYHNLGIIMSITSSNRLLPAYPLFVKDPFFSLWSKTDKLNESDVMFWNGLQRKIYGVIYADGMAYCFLGNNPRGNKLNQRKIKITAFTTEYEFECDKFDLSVSFVSPLLPNDLEVLSCPVCYLKYEIIPKVKIENLRIAVFIGESICYNTVPMPVCGGVYDLTQGKTAWFGLKKQLLLSQSTDSSAAEWGYWYITGKSAGWFDEEALLDFYKTGKFETHDSDFSEKFIGAMDEYENLQQPVNGKFSVAFDDLLSIAYFGDYLKGYFFNEGRTIFDAISYAWNNFDVIEDKLQKFDNELKKSAERYGEDYLLILYASLRQSVGAHKLVKNRNGEILFLSKECHSGGFIATVDVSYPSIPLYLLYNPELVKGMLCPIFELAKTNSWTYDFAPHDAGIYPYCTGQLYGFDVTVKENKDKFINCQNWAGRCEIYTPYTYLQLYAAPNENGKLYPFKMQMPVEECGNMLIMTAAILAVDGDIEFARSNFDNLKKWVKYLVKYGLKPGNQLCTDDFSGHLDKNVNLSVKAIVGIRSFAYICEKLGKVALSRKYNETAKNYSEKWRQMCEDISPLAFGNYNSYSIKYNMLFDVLFGTDLFERDLIEKEVDYCLSKIKKYGIPLDNRADLTKSDWLAWFAAMTNDYEKRETILASVARYLREGGTRLPFSDFYDSSTGERISFTNRSVQGGMFAPLLADSGICKICK